MKRGYIFAVLVWLLTGAPVWAQQGPAIAHPLAKISKTWEDEGFSVGWIQKMADRLKFLEPDGNVPAGLVPSFQVKREDVKLEVLSRLPRPTEPFGIDLWSHQWPADFLKHLARFDKLHTLRIDMSTNSKDGLRHVTALSQLHSLSITLGDAPNDTLEELAKLKSLHTLVIHAKSIQSVEKLVAMKQLRTLVISTHNAPKGLADLKNLTSLSLCARVADDNLREIGELSSLTELWICDAGITDAQTKYLSKLDKLEFLSLSYNELKGPGLKDIGRLPNLRGLYLGNNKISDAGLEHLANCKRLQDLSLEWNDITDVGLTHLERVKTLERIHVYSTRVTKVGEAKLRKALPKLRFYQPPPEKAA